MEAGTELTSGRATEFGSTDWMDEGVSIDGDLERLALGPGATAGLVFVGVATGAEGLADAMNELICARVVLALGSTAVCDCFVGASGFGTALLGVASGASVNLLDS
jgi:hypothetical protein